MFKLKAFVSSSLTLVLKWRCRDKLVTVNIHYFCSFSSACQVYYQCPVASNGELTVLLLLLHVILLLFTVVVQWDRSHTT